MHRYTSVQCNIVSSIENSFENRVGLDSWTDAAALFRNNFESQNVVGRSINLPNVQVANQWVFKFSTCIALSGEAVKMKRLMNSLPFGESAMMTEKGAHCLVGAYYDSDADEVVVVALRGGRPLTPLNSSGRQ
eukprot:2573224-Pleurochrysis_carterae.AAC.2